MCQVDTRAAGLQRVGSPVPAVGGFQHDVRVGAGLFDLTGQGDGVVVDTDVFYDLTGLGHAHDY
jgi:hypothetical protein